MIDCPQCGATIPESAIEPTLGVAECPACGAISEVAPPAEANGSGAVDPPVEPPVLAPRARVVPPVPSGWSDGSPTEIDLRRRWFGAGAIPMLLFSLLWNGFLLVGLAGFGLDLLFMPHTWIGLGLLYWSAASILNTTTIQWDRRILYVKHGPVPWFGNRAIEARDLSQLYVKLSSVRVNKRPRWNLLAQKSDGREVVLVRLLSRPEEAKWLEARIEDAMGIVDRHVPGEV
jgi:hypothetical protein